MAALGNRPGFLIRRLHQIHLALFAEECAPFGVTPVQFSIMTVAKAQPGLEQVALAHEVGVDRATLANVLTRLEGRGLVSRAATPSDRRVKRVSLTRRGSLLLTRMTAAAERAHDRTIAALTPAEREAFLAALRSLVSAGNEHGRAPMRRLKRGEGSALRSRQRRSL
ncbi:MAG: MarR family transcriptional regulator [Acetobacteraceae bacterium]